MKRRPEISFGSSVVVGFVLLAMVVASLPAPVVAQVPPIQEYIAPTYESVAITESGVPIVPEVPVAEQQLRDISSNILKAVDPDRKTIAIDEAGERTFRARFRTASAIAIKTSLHFLLNTLAYDTATWLATGASGQQPMFFTENWGEYLTNVLDGTAGTFIEGFGQGFSNPVTAREADAITQLQAVQSQIETQRRLVEDQQTGQYYTEADRQAELASLEKFGDENYAAIQKLGKGGKVNKGKGFLDRINVCKPSTSVQISLGLGLEQLRRPRAPRCTFSQMLSNWENELASPDFLNKFDVSFDPSQNDIGISLTLLGAYFEDQARAKEEATKTREEGQGWQGVVSKVSGKILTPYEYTSKQAGEALSKGTVGYETLYQDIAGDAVNVFVSTLAGKLFEQLFKKGLAALSGLGKETSGGGGS